MDVFGLNTTIYRDNVVNLNRPQVELNEVEQKKALRRKTVEKCTAMSLLLFRVAIANQRRQSFCIVQ